MSTPTKKRCVDIRYETCPSFDPDVRDGFEGNIRFDVPFEEFIKNVYGITEADIKAFRTRDWGEVVGQGELLRYRKAVRQKTHETQRYPSFRQIMKALASALPDHEALSFCVNMARSNANTRDTRQPDGTVLWERILPSWEVIKVAIDVKSRRRSYDEDEEEEETQVRTPPDILMCAKPSTSIKARPRPPIPPAYPDQSSNGIQHCNEDHTSASPPMLSESSNNGSSSRKRPHSHEPMLTNKRVCPSRLTIHQAQVVNYAQKSMTAACRRWTVGIVVDDYCVTVWYFDRMGAIVTESFNFSYSLWKLALLTLALARCTPTQAGYEPLIIKGGTQIDPATSVLPFERPLISVIDAEVILPTDIKKLSNDDPRYTIVGEALYVCRTIVGVGTIVYPVKLAGGPDPGPELVAKWSWPLDIRPFQEHEIITHLRETVPWMREHLPEVIDYREFSMEELDLPRCKFGDLSGVRQEERRRLAILVVPRYRHLCEVNSLAEFQDVFVDLVECHYHTYKWGHVLHRDLSEKNMMWTFSKDGLAKGILNDWDRSSKVCPSTVDITAYCRTGTLPFMARELLRDDPPAHLYRHDLESFLYILIWAMVHYDLGGAPDDPQCLDTNYLLDPWLSDDLEENKDSKVCLFWNPNMQRELFYEVQPAFEPLIDTWLRPLLRLFLDASKYRYDCRSSSGYDNVTLGGILTFERFMEAIGRQPREILHDV